MEALRICLRDLWSKNYEKRDSGKSEDEVKKEQDERLEAYDVIIMGGLSGFFLKDSISMLEKVYMKTALGSYFLAFYFVFAVLSMVLGLIACKFPLSAPYHMGTAGFGALQGLIFLLVGIHLDTFLYYPCWICPIITFAMAILALTMYWGYSAQDPVGLQLITKLLGWILWWACEILWNVFLKVMEILWNIFWYPMSALCRYLKDNFVHTPRRRSNRRPCLYLQRVPLPPFDRYYLPE